MGFLESGWACAVPTSAYFDTLDPAEIEPCVPVRPVSALTMSDSTALQQGFKAFEQTPALGVRDLCFHVATKLECRAASKVEMSPRSFRRTGRSKSEMRQ
uniref:Uncharacterized protein n=1 Tax=Rhizobium loti TaxID=381 RepID=Q8KGX9_RHILI|nr:HYPOTHETICAL PROTEIN [Mesorhizobium japonicum R7A]